jgi:hypothetical protein
VSPSNEGRLRRMLERLALSGGESQGAIAASLLLWAEFLDPILDANVYTVTDCSQSEVSRTGE